MMDLFSYLHHSLERLVTLLVGPRLLEVAPDAHVLAEENLAVVLKPVQDLRRRLRLMELKFPNQSAPQWPKFS